MGAHLVLCARKEDRCHQAEELRALGVKAIALACDVGGRRAFRRWSMRLYPIRTDRCPNPQRRNILGPPVEEVRLEDWNKVFETNLTWEVCCRDECNRPDSTLEGLLALKPHFDPHSGEGTMTAGNSSQRSDGFGHSVDVVRVRLSAGSALQLVFRGFQVAGCDPDEMGFGAVFCRP